MLFNSIEFLIFLPIVFAVYWLLRRWTTWQNVFVVVASYVFYGWWDWHFLLLIAFTTLCSYISGVAIEKTKNVDEASQRTDATHHISTFATPKLQNSKTSKLHQLPISKMIMWANIVLNLAVLGVFKYYDFFAQSFADVFLGGHADGMLLHWVLPVGISFYTFQALSYSIDVYRGSMHATRDVVAFFAYVSFFPQLVAGPIERATNLLPQFRQERHFDYRQAVDGMRQMLWGFFKKAVVADSCALYVDEIFAHPDWFNGATLLVAAVLFTIQIYGDFSGYSDIAIGCAKLFGIRLRRNFNVPYFSRDIAEFWRRWHISLTTWFRDYIYIPLGGSRVPKGRVVLNTFVIFLVSGLWHGANWTFLAWGAYHALLFLPLILLGKNRKHTDVVASGNSLPTLRELGQILLTFFLAAMGWVLFRSDSIADAWHYYVRMFSTLFDGKVTITAPIDAWIIGISMTVLTIVEWLNRGEDHEFVRMPRNRMLRWGAYVALIFTIGACMVTNEMPFIYFQF